MTAKPITICICLRDRGEQRYAELRGFGYISAGFLAGEITPGSSTWGVCDSVLASLFTFTGCPIVARTPDPVLNPWLETGGSYRANRRLRIGEAEIFGSLISTGSSSGIEMVLNIRVECGLPKLTRIAMPFQEAIRARGPGLLCGEFEAAVTATDGENETARACTEYHLPITRVPEPVWRNITVFGRGDDAQYLQVEQIDLFGNSRAASDDLNAKHAAVSLDDGSAYASRR